MDWIQRQQHPTRTQVIDSAADSPPNMHRAATPHLDVRMFGAFDVRLQGRAVSRWGAGRTRNLCQYLLVNLGRRVTSAQLHEVLWPDSERAQETSSLKVACHGLRKALGARRDDGGLIRLRYLDFGYVLQVEDARIDVTEFRRLVAAGLHAERLGNTDAARTHLEGAMWLYRGDFLEGESSDWVVAHREYLKSLAMLAVEALRRIAEHAGDTLGVIDLCDRALDLDPYHEATYRALVGLHGRRGELDRVQGWFRLCTERLRHDLGVAPEPETVTAFIDELIRPRSGLRFET